MSQDNHSSYLYIATDVCEQTFLTEIRQLEQSDQGLHCLPAVVKNNIHCNTIINAGAGSHKIERRYK